MKLTKAFCNFLAHSNAKLALLVGLLSPAFAEEVPENDVVFRALGDELKRAMSLHLADLDKPYFVQYSVDDTVTYRTTATYGAVVNSDQNRSRVFQSQVRVGSYDLDNSNFAGRGGVGGRRGLSGSAELPVDDDYASLRHAIWLATDTQYKDAVETLTQKRAYMKDRNLQERAVDFAKAKSVSAIQPRINLTFDRKPWEDYARRISASFESYRHIQNSDLSLAAGAENRYLVNSEDSRLRYSDTGAILRITAGAQTPDGQRISDSLVYYAPSLEGLPELEQVLADVGKLADRFAAMLKAPILEDYTGPVLFDGVASAQLFRQLLAAGVTGQPDPVGSQRRASQGGDDLETRLGKRILPTTFHIYDDPRDRQFQDTFLAGHYLFDDEGVPAERVEIVVDGKLDGMVMSRTPTKQFAKSNGHGRRVGGEAPRSAVGCLYIEAAKGLSPEELKKELIDAAEAEGLKFGLKITGLSGRVGGTSGFGGPGGRFGRGGGGRGGAGRLVGDPISIYRVHVADGREEPVRGCEFSSLDLRSLRRIIAAGNVQTVHNSAGGGAPASSVIAPAILFEELELSRIRQEAEKKPILEAPHARQVRERGP
ncbi:MAG: hypothetical protein HYY23_00790 [Verrucomicrobia bacterium]|nr:hypothetical protein [Verrucomicrobiota bacterium]